MDPLLDRPPLGEGDEKVEWEATWRNLEGVDRDEDPLDMLMGSVLCEVGCGNEEVEGEDGSSGRTSRRKEDEVAGAREE